MTDEKRERILHAIKKVAQMQVMLSNAQSKLNHAIDELAKEIYGKPIDAVDESC